MFNSMDKFYVRTTASTPHASHSTILNFRTTAANAYAKDNCHSPLPLGSRCIRPDEGVQWNELN